MTSSVPPPPDVCAFAHRAAHDLRAPLVRIRSFAGIVGEGAALDEQDRRCLEIISRSARDAATLVDRLLAFTIASHRPLERRVVDVRERLDTVIEGLSAQIAHADAAIELDGIASVEADPELLEVLCTELLTNAIAFREPGRGPRITVRLDAASERTPAFLRVFDDGPGVPEGRRVAILEPFEAGPDAHGVLGPGLGLALCSVVCERHAWTLGVHDPGAGTEVRVQLGRGDDPEPAD